ncbi:unnamed protein product [Effrenium voratum]|nr:unnamed protein product [Effrenium voratum]
MYRPTIPGDFKFVRAGAFPHGSQMGSPLATPQMSKMGSPLAMPQVSKQSLPMTSERLVMSSPYSELAPLKPTCSVKPRERKEPCEEDCDKEKFGAEEKGPREEKVCGLDPKPALPAALAASTLMGGLCMMVLQIPLLSQITHWPRMVLSVSFALLCAVTLGCMIYCIFADPGQARKTRNAPHASDLEEAKPTRTHKSWLYSRPIRRYDHYCRWLMNVIGLLNHREFFVMLLGLASIALLGLVVDLFLAVAFLANLAETGATKTSAAALGVGLHLAYSVVLMRFEGPILLIHVGLISRNETANEWKKDIFYVAYNTKHGDKVPVEDLDSDEHNELFDRQAFVYDPTRNSFDRGCPTNWWNFWCKPRWSEAEQGDF